MGATRTNWDRVWSILSRLIRSGGFWFSVYTLAITALTAWGCYHFRDELMASPDFSAAVRNIGLVWGGLLGLGLAAWRSLIAERQAESTRLQASVADRESRAARANSLNERYQRAVELLGSDRAYIRIGGIHALRNLARENPQEFVQHAMSLLRAFQETPMRSSKDGTGDLPQQQEFAVAEKAIGDLEILQLTRGVDALSFYDDAKKIAAQLDTVIQADQPSSTKS